MMGVQGTSVSIMMTFWNHPLIMLLISVWAIGRGSGAVAAEIERGTMDLILSRPLSRSAYLASQVLYATVGLAILATALFVGASIALHYNFLREPPSSSTLVRPAINLLVLGLPIYGYTLFASSLDHVRWRPTSIGSVLTLGGIIAYVVSMIPVFEDSSWKPWLERVSIFKAYNPIELVDAGETFTFNVSVLTGLGAALIVAAFVAFSVRDLPTNG
jgi:ABC-2 type transport system permease protein